MSLYQIPTVGNVPATPFYYYDMELLDSTLKSCSTHAALHGYTVHYAMKANIESRILHAIRVAGFGADCVSGWEVEAALAAGFEASQVVFAGVGKSDSEIRYALREDIFCFNCESLNEIEVLNSLAAEVGCVARIALRLNPDIEPETHKYVSTGQATSKFGIAPSELNEVLVNLPEYKNLTIIGIHFHIGSSILNLSSFEQLCHKANELNDWFLSQGIDLQHLNMGGGLGIDYDDPTGTPIPDFETFFNVFARNLRVRPTQKVHFELGRSLVGQCADLVTRVLYSKRTGSGEQFLIVDAGMTELIRPALYSTKHRIEIVSALGEDRPLQRYYVGGPICESSDIFAYDTELPLSHRGDVMSIRSVGAYGSIMSSHYNLRPSALSYFSSIIT